MIPHREFTQEEIEELILPCIDSTPMTGVTLFSEHFTRPFCALHDVIFSYIDDGSKRLVALAAPRGFGKTTIVGLSFVARLALFRLAPYIVYISATATEAAAKVKIVAQELQYNEMIKELFGDLKGVKWAEEKGEIELSDENGPFCFIQAKGAGSQVRGLKWGKHRPTIFIVDDLEDKEDCQNELSRKKLKAWFYGSLLGAMDNADFSDSRLVLIGTIVHEDSILANLIDEDRELTDGVEGLELDSEAMEILLSLEKFHTIRLEACNDALETNWPEFMSTARIRAKAAAYKRMGQIDVFYMEFRNMVIAGDNASFQSSMFKLYDEQFDKEDLKFCENVIIVDPAKTANVTSADSAVICVGFNPILNRIYFRDCVAGKLNPNEIFKAALDMAVRYNASAIGLEVTGLNNFATYPFEQYIQQSEYNRYFQIVELKAIKAKDLRVAAMVPFYRMGVVYHNRDLHVRGKLEAQLLSFPYSKLWDVMDAFSYFIEMFAIGERTFTTNRLLPNTEDPKLLEDEYRILELEDKMEEPLSSWRLI